MNTLKRVTIDQVHPSPDNLREDVGDIEELARSIAGVGLLEPMVTRANDDGFELVAGERRWSAINWLVKSKEFPEITKATTWEIMVRPKTGDAEQTAAMIVENLHRAGLTPIEEFRGIARLAAEHKWDAATIAKTTGISERSVKDRMAWMVFDDEQLGKLVKANVIVEDMTALAKCSADEIEAAFTHQHGVGQGLRTVLRNRRITKERNRTKNQLRKAGMFVLGLDTKDDEAAAAALAELEQVAERLEANVAWRNSWSPTHYLDDFAPGTVFKCTIDTYGHTGWKSAYVPAVEEAVDRVETADNDWDRDNAKAEIAQAEWREARQAAQVAAEKAYLLDTPKATLLASVLGLTAAKVDRVMGQQRDRLFEVFDVESVDDLMKYAGANSTQLVQVAAAAYLYSYPYEPDLEFELPEQPGWPDGDEYDDDGKWVGLTAVGPEEFDGAPEEYAPYLDEILNHNARRCKERKA